VPCDDICSNPPELICHCQCPGQWDCLRVHYHGTWQAHSTPVISIIINNRRYTLIRVSECPSGIRYSLKARFSDLYHCIVLLKLNKLCFVLIYRPHVQGRNVCRAHLLASCLFLGSCWATIMTMKMMAIQYSETSLGLYPTKRRHNPDDPTLHSHHIDNLKSNMDEA
jgi:hypothetical protein